MNQIKDLFCTYETSKALVDAGLVHRIKVTDGCLTYVDGDPCINRWVFGDTYKETCLVNGYMHNIVYESKDGYIPVVSCNEIKELLQILHKTDTVQILTAPIVFWSIEDWAKICLIHFDKIIEQRKKDQKFRSEEQKEKYRLTRIGGKVEKIMQEATGRNCTDIVADIYKIIERES